MLKEGPLDVFLFSKEISCRVTIVHYTAFSIIEKRSNPLNKVSTKAKRNGCSIESNAFSKLAEKRIASISFSLVYLSISLSNGLIHQCTDYLHRLFDHNEQVLQ